MSSRIAPRAATWLLERVGGGSRFEPLIGDLAEQFEEGRSRLWYWRQAVGTLAIDLAQTIRLHAFSFIAAVVVGCASIWLWDAGWPHLAQPLYANLAAVSQHPWTAQAGLRVAGLEMIGVLADVLLFVTVWAVIRIHRSHPRAVLSVFVVAVTAPYIPILARSVIHAATDPRVTTPLVPILMPFLWQALCIFAAGLWVARRLSFTGRGRPHFVAILAVSLCVLAGLARAAGRVGEITYTLHESYVPDVLNVGSVAYLVLLLWRPGRTSRMSGEPPTHAGGGPRAQAAKSE